jgi:hypothetical protein
LNTQHSEAQQLSLEKIVVVSLFFFLCLFGVGGPTVAGASHVTLVRENRATYITHCGKNLLPMMMIAIKKKKKKRQLVF